MNHPYTPPARDKGAFHCPYCQVFALQRWWIVRRFHSNFGQFDIDDYRVCACDSCGKLSMWFSDKMVVPDTSAAPLPAEDMPDDVKEDYDEARSVFSRSPRSSSALLRLAVQKLCIDLGGSGKNLNDDIGILVKKGLPVQIQQALDVLRVIGNNQVHPGILDIRDDPATASSLFGLINMVVEVMITQPKHVEALFNKLPANAQQQIQRRDSDKP